MRVGKDLGLGRRNGEAENKKGIEASERFERK